MIFWIASYPKSGNTWMRALLSAYFFSDDGIFNQNLLKYISQFPQKKFLKEFKYNPNLVADTSKFWIKAQEKINLNKQVNFFKTHNILGAIGENNFTNAKNTIGCIYIVRDPRNVITSLKNHYELNYNEALSFMKNDRKFIYDYNLKNDYSDFQLISSWENHFKSWKNQNFIKVKFIKYEDLYEKTYTVFKDVIEFIIYICNFKQQFQKQKAIRAIDSTNFSKLSEMEKKIGFNEAIQSKKNNNKIPFFSMGINNDWKKIIEKDFQKKLTTEFSAGLRELLYI